MSTTPKAPSAKSGLLNGLDIVVCLALLAIGTPFCLMATWIDLVEPLRGGAARRAGEQTVVVLTLLLVPLPCVLWIGSRAVWRAVAEIPRFHRQVIRGAILALFCAPSLVVIAGQRGGFGLPGPAFLMLIFGQWKFKFWLGLLPILVVWPIVVLVYSACERRANRIPCQRTDGKDLRGSCKGF